MQDSVSSIENGICAESSITNASNKKEDACKIFVGGLSWDTTREKLAEYFSQFGEIVDCVLMLDTQTRRSRGFGFVTYASPKAVFEVLANCPHFLDGKFIDPKAAVPKLNYPLPQKQNTIASTNPVVNIPSTGANLSFKKYNKIFVGGIGQASEEDLRVYFSTFGRVTEVSIIMDKLTGRPRGFAFVGFDDCKAAEATVSVRYHSIRNKKVEVKKALPRDIKMVENCLKDFTSFNPDDLMFSNLSIHDAIGVDNITSDSVSLSSPQIWKSPGSISMSVHHPTVGPASMVSGDVNMTYGPNCGMPTTHSMSYASRSAHMSSPDFGADSYGAGVVPYDHVQEIMSSGGAEKPSHEYFLAFEQNENRLPRSIYPNSSVPQHGYHHFSTSRNLIDDSSHLPPPPPPPPCHVYPGGGDELEISAISRHESLKKSFSDKPGLHGYSSQTYHHIDVNYTSSDATAPFNKTMPNHHHHPIRSAESSYESISSGITSKSYNGAGVMDELTVSKYKYSNKFDHIGSGSAVTNHCSENSNVSVFSSRSCDTGSQIESSNEMGCVSSSMTIMKDSAGGGYHHQYHHSAHRTSDPITNGTKHLSSTGMVDLRALTINNHGRGGVSATVGPSSSDRLNEDEDTDGAPIPSDLRTNIINLLNEIWK